jgi:hypothetical protein
MLSTGRNGTVRYDMGLPYETLQPARTLGENTPASVLDRQLFAAVQESAFGPKRTRKGRRSMSASEVITDIRI